MTNTKSKGKVLHFEDNKELRELFNKHLVKENYQVYQFSQFPAEGISAIKGEIAGMPDIVLMDINMPDINGYTACEILRRDYLEPSVPVVFISALGEENDVLKAYEVGADDYLVKPIRLNELTIKLEHLLAIKQKIDQQNEQAKNAQKMAFEAMSTSSELGRILRFHEQIYTTDNLDEIAALILQGVTGFSLKSSLMLFMGKESYYSDDGLFRPLESKVLSAFKKQTRIFSWKNKTFFNYQYFSVLIKDMPIDDEERYGTLKDQLCILLNGVDARLEAILIEKSNQSKAITMKIAADTIANMVMEIEHNNIELSKNFESVILKMESNIGADIIQFNLLENEEKILMSHVITAIKESTDIFEKSIEKEKQYKSIMNSLLTSLISKK